MTVWVAFAGGTDFSIESFSDAGAHLGHWAVGSGSADHLGNGHGLRLFGGALYAWHLTPASGIYPDAPDGVSIFTSPHHWYVEKFANPAALSGQSTITITQPDAFNGYGNSNLYSPQVDVAASGDLVLVYRHGTGSSNPGFGVHDPTTGNQNAFYTNAVSPSQCEPSGTWVMVPGSSADAYAIDPAASFFGLAKGPINNWPTASTFYTTHGSFSPPPSAFCVDEGTGDLFVAYLDAVTSDYTIDRVDSSGTWIQTYVITTTAFTQDNNQTSIGNGMAAAGGKLVVNPYLADHLVTNEIADGIWIIDQATGAGSTDAAFQLGLGGTPFGAPICTALEYERLTGWHVGYVGMGG